jgi:hypothetical protein
MEAQLKKAPEPRQTVMVARILWAILLFSVFNLLLVLNFMTPENPQEFGDKTPYREFFNNSYSQILLASAFVAALLSFFLPFWIGPQTRGPTKTVRGFVPLIIRLALAESVSLIGFALAQTYKSSSIIYPFIGMSVFLFLLSFPTQERLESFVGRDR